MMLDGSVMDMELELEKDVDQAVYWYETAKRGIRLVAAFI